MFYKMLGSKVRSRSRFGGYFHIIKQIHCASQEIYGGVNNSHPIYLDSLKGQSNSSSVLGYWNSILFSPKLSYKGIMFFKVFYSSKPTNPENMKSSAKESDDKLKKPKKEIKTYITLIGTDSSISVSTVEAAKKLADRRNFKLVKVMDFDPKSSRAVYKLMSESQYMKEDWDDSTLKRDKSNKDDKLVSLSSSTNENDVLTKIKMMKKWLTKKFDVKVVITGDISSAENVYKIVEREIGSEGRIVQKRVKGSSIRFQILLPKVREEKVAEKTDKK